MNAPGLGRKRGKHTGRCSGSLQGLGVGEGVAHCSRFLGSVSVRKALGSSLQTAAFSDILARQKWHRLAGESLLPRAEVTLGFPGPQLLPHSPGVGPLHFSHHAAAAYCRGLP